MASFRGCSGLRSMKATSLASQSHTASAASAAAVCMKASSRGHKDSHMPAGTPALLQRQQQLPKTMNVQDSCAANMYLPHLSVLCAWLLSPPANVSKQLIQYDTQVCLADISVQSTPQARTHTTLQSGIVNAACRMCTIAAAGKGSLCHSYIQHQHVCGTTKHKARGTA